jgi:hypothetical protein
MKTERKHGMYRVDFIMKLRENVYVKYGQEKRRREKSRHNKKNKRRKIGRTRNNSDK